MLHLKSIPVRIYGKFNVQCSLRPYNCYIDSWLLPAGAFVRKLALTRFYIETCWAHCNAKV